MIAPYLPLCHLFHVPATTRASRHASTLIHKRIAILPITNRKLNVVVKSLGMRFNPVGRLLDICVDMMAVTAESMRPSRQKGYGRLSKAAVLAIRRSKDKIAVIALETGVSEAMVIKIRAKKCYKWIR